VDHRSQTKRLAAPAVVCLAGVLPFLSGCQSGAQSDLIARELRMQEDKIYAQQDYLDQYQQLICKYRAENIALKRMLADHNPGEAPRHRDPTTGEPASARGRAAPTEAPAIPPLPPTRPSEPADLQIPPLDATKRQPPMSLDRATPDEANEPPGTQPENTVQLASYSNASISNRRESMPSEQVLEHEKSFALQRDTDRSVTSSAPT
jgi:hypothetical protein